MPLLYVDGIVEVIIWGS